MTSPGIIVPMPVADVSADALLQVLHDRFGHTGFRPGQEEVVRTIVAGDDCVVVMPTGGGKSLCYQLPAVAKDTPTLVVSPLIALMKDQVDALRVRGITAAALHSNLDAVTQRAVERAWLDGSLRLLYVAPERLVRDDCRALLARRPVGCIVVDEAHCISEWGHDFRRDYLRLGEVIAQSRPVQVVACTATATPAVRDDIVARLGLDRPRSFVHGFDRPRLHLSVERCRDEGAKLVRLDELIDPADGRTIVYAGTRARAGSLADRLGQRFPTMLYHGDLDATTRTAAQERFASGAVRVAVTTSAFGMGVDVPNVRQVIHVALPGSLEEYYQQAGRAGRDGLAAQCVLLHAPADRRLQEFFIDAAHPDAATLASVYASVRSAGHDPGAWRNVEPVGQLAARLSDAAGDAARELLRHHGVIERTGKIADHDPGRLPVDHARVAAHRRLAYGRLDQLATYLGGRACRHRLILDHFGEDAAGLVCGGCDVCSAGRTAVGAALDSTVIRQALSAAARLNGRIGVAKLAGVLTGSRSRAVQAIPGVTQLSVYGVLAGWRDADAVEMLRRLVDVGALAQTPPPYATVVLTPPGVAVMRGDQEVVVEDPRRLRLPAAAIAAGRADPAAGLDAAGADLLSRLRAWRTAQASSRAVPAYVVLPDRTLSALASLAAIPPESTEDLLAVPGIGPAKAAQYGMDLLRLLAETPAGLDG